MIDLSTVFFIVGGAIAGYSIRGLVETLRGNIK